MFDFYLLAIKTLSDKLCYVLLHTFLPIYFPKVMVHFCRTWMNGVAGSLKDLVPQPIYIGNTQPTLIPQNTIPPKENVSLSLLRTDSFNSVNDWSRCCLNFTSTTKDDSELWWTMKPPFRESSNLTQSNQPMSISHEVFLGFIYVRRNTNGHTT